MASNIDLIYHTEALAISKTSAVERGLSGQYQVLGTGSQKIGGIPSARVSVTGETYRITPGAARQAVNKYITDGNTKAGKLFSKALSHPEFRNMRSMPERMALSAIMADSAAGKVHAWRHYTKMAANYVEQHAGGMIGDGIKEEFFQGGRLKWQPLKLKTIEEKTKRYGKYKGRVPKPAIPLYGTTFTATLPDGWQMYTYRWGDWPKGLQMMGPNKAYTRGGFKTPGLMRTKEMTYGNKSGIVRPELTTYLSPDGSFYKQPSPIAKGKTAYPPGMRGTSLIDVVAHLAPVAAVLKPYPGRGYQGAVKSTMNDMNPSGNANMQVDGIVQPFYTVPYVWAHEFGMGTSPARPFIYPGLAAGMGNVERLFHLYLEGGHKAVKKAYAETGFSGLKTLNEIDAHYRMGAIEAAEAAKKTKIHKNRGNKEPKVTLFDLKHDAIRYKRQKLTSVIRKLFGNHLIWWFLPPTKYWHYIGMLSDIRGLLFGKKNMGAAYAYVKAMSIGLAGARMGSPVPFTRKARRRKFRKGLYTRAGYHRKQVGGS